MLSIFRSAQNNWLMVAILFAITFVFVFTFGSWGGGDVSGALPVAATVNGEVIPMSQFRVNYAQSFRTQTMFRPGFSPEQARDEGLDQQVLDRLIDAELLAQAAKKRGLVINDDELAEAVQERFFGKDKPFDLEEYKRLVNGVYNTTEARFEGQLRKDLLAQKMERILGDALHVSETELKDSYLQKNDKAELEFLKVDPLFFKKDVKDATPEEVVAWVAANKPAVEAFYNEHINRYRQSKKVNARHILVKVKDTASDDEKKAARAKLQKALDRVKGGEDFAVVAKEASEDSSASQGGSLGLFGEGAMVKPFEEAAFKLEKDQISDIVETKFGYHVIKVEEVQPPTKKEIGEVENDIGRQLVRESAQKAKAKALADAALVELKAGKSFAELSDKAIVKPPVDGQPPVDPTTLDPFAPRIESTGLFAKSARVVPRIGVAPAVVDLAFKTLSMGEPLAGEVLDVNGRFFVLRLKNREEPDMAKFNEEKEGLQQTMLAARRGDVVTTFAKDLKEKARIERNAKLLTTM